MVFPAVLVQEMIQSAMRSVPGFTHLYTRNGTYTFRAPTPENLSPFFGGKTERKKSLGTKDFGAARKSWFQETQIFEAELRNAHSQNEGMARRPRPTTSEAFALVRV